MSHVAFKQSILTAASNGLLQRCSIGIFSTCDDVGNTEHNFSDSQIDFDGSGSGIYWQIRANGSETLTIYNAAFDGRDILRMSASTSVSDTS